MKNDSEYKCIVHKYISIREKGGSLNCELINSVYLIIVIIENW
jgi:hypothetical protein